MSTKHILTAILVAVSAPWCFAQDETPPAELRVLQSYVGVWDAEIEVWPQGMDAPSITFQGAETNRAYGKYWIASDFDSVFMGQTMKIHSIVGYDLDGKKVSRHDHRPWTLPGQHDGRFR